MNKNLIIPTILITVITIAVIAVAQLYLEPPTMTTSLKLSDDYLSTNLFGAEMNIPDEIQYVNNILDKIELECYAVAWYNNTENGQAIVFMNTFKEIENSMPENQTGYKFLENTLVRKYLEINCLHLHTMNDLPNDYNNTMGMNPLDACLDYNDLKWFEKSTTRTLNKELIENFIEQTDKNIEKQQDWLTIESMTED